MQPEFFGNNSELFGIYLPPRGRPTRPVRAVVICPPIGHEYIRSHWCLRLLAAQLARKGIHVLRFDYLGIGDSMGSPSDVNSLAQWEQNIVTAVERLISLSGADTCSLLGLRSGSALSASVAQQVDQVNSLLLWEPVLCGESWLRSMRRMHAEMLDLWVCKMQTANDDVGEELLGTMYSRGLIDDLSQYLIDWEHLHLPHVIVDSKNRKSLYQSNNSMQKVILTEDDNSWDDLRQLETAWLRPQTSRLVVDTVEDVFQRLKRFGVLDATLEAAQ